MVVSRSPEARRSSSSATALRFRSSLAPASWESRDCAITSSPTRSISSSSRSAGTRREELPRSAAAATAIGSLAGPGLCLPVAASPGAAAASSIAAETSSVPSLSGSTTSIDRSMPSRMNRKTSSIFSSPPSVVSVTSHPSTMHRSREAAGGRRSQWYRQVRAALMAGSPVIKPHADEGRRHAPPPQRAAAERTPPSGTASDLGRPRRVLDRRKAH